MRRFIAILAVLLLMGLPAGALAQAPAEGTINGQVINGTEGGGSVGGVEISLITYINGQLSDTRTAVSDSEGKFQFDSINMEHTYLVSARYMDVDYYYPVAFEPGETTAYVEVGVCDTTASDEKIRVGLTRKIVNIEEESLLVTEVYWLVNDGDRTYVGTDGVLLFQLPQGAYCFEAPEELMIDYRLLDDNRVTHLVSFPPGERQLFYSYRLARTDSNELGIALVINYPTDVLELMVEGEGVEVAVSRLAPAEPVVTDTGERYIYFQGQNLSRNEVINVRLSNLSGGGGFPLFILWIVIATAVACIAVYMIRRIRKVDIDG
ncbi:MAG: hypothetical protein KAS25_01485 [Dehalococcoidales bacterium]|nr:hypothetical protein [Dehalococcoidales bacterium]